MPVFSQLLYKHIKGNANKYDKFKSKNKFCIILKIYQKVCLTEARGSSPQNQPGEFEEDPLAPAKNQITPSQCSSLHPYHYNDYTNSNTYINDVTNFLLTSYSSTEHKGTTMLRLAPPHGILRHASCGYKVELCNIVN